MPKPYTQHPKHRTDLTNLYGRGQPRSLILSFVENPWYDVRGEIQCCDRLKRTYSLENDTSTWHVHKYAVFDQSQRCISPRTSIHGISPNDSVSDSGWPLALIHLNCRVCAPNPETHLKRCERNRCVMCGLRPDLGGGSVSDGHWPTL